MSETSRGQRQAPWTGKKRCPVSIRCLFGWPACFFRIGPRSVVKSSMPPRACPYVVRSAVGVATVIILIVVPGLSVRHQETDSAWLGLVPKSIKYCATTTTTRDDHDGKHCGNDVECLETAMSATGVDTPTLQQQQTDCSIHRQQ